MVDLLICAIHSVRDSSLERPTRMKTICLAEAFVLLKPHSLTYMSHILQLSKTH